ncbi:unnamed protein product [Peniophora sp. CBMAI 1063]|nr:unnamed protein product [Peniophora sp. CBMAI 1063]
MLSLLANSVISLTFGYQSALERVFRLIHPAYANFLPFDAFISFSTIRAAHLPGLPYNTIGLFAYDDLNIHPVDKLLLDTGLPGPPAPYCILDLIAHEPSLIIPSRLFIPHEGSNRKEAFLQRTDMLPIFFARSDGGFGVRIDSNADFDMLLDSPTRVTAHSLKVLLHLINYPSYEKQIQLRNTAASPVSSRRLARLIASKVSYIVKEAARENASIVHWTNPRWKMGSGAGRISVADIELMGIVFVSRGKVTPLLRVRSDFVFAT